MGYEDSIADRLMGARKGKLNEYIDSNTIDRINQEIDKAGDAIDNLLRLASRVGETRFTGHVNGLHDAWEATSESAEGLEDRENLESVSEAVEYRLLAEVLEWARNIKDKSDQYAFRDGLEAVFNQMKTIHDAASEIKKILSSKLGPKNESKTPFEDRKSLLASELSRGMKISGGEGGKPRIVTGVYRKADHIVVQYDDGVFQGEEPYKPDERVKLAEAEWKVNPETGHEILDIDPSKVSRVWDNLPPFAQMTALDVVGAKASRMMQGVRISFRDLPSAAKSAVLKGWDRIMKDLKNDPLTKKYVHEAYDPEQFKKIAAKADKEKVGGKYPEDVEWSKKTSELKKKGLFREPDEPAPKKGGSQGRDQGGKFEAENPFAQKVAGSIQKKSDDRYAQKVAGSVVPRQDDDKYVKKSAGSVKGEGAAYGGLQASKDDETKEESSEPWGKRFPGKITPPASGTPMPGPRTGWERELDKQRKDAGDKSVGQRKVLPIPGKKTNQAEAKSDMSREDKRMYYSGWQVGVADKKRGNDATFKSVRAGIRSYPSWNEGFMDGWEGKEPKVKSPMEFLESWVGDFAKDIEQGRGRAQS